MAKDDGDAVNQPFLPPGMRECEDDDVRLFLSLAGWDVESDVSRTRHVIVWRYLNAQIDRAEKLRSLRATLIVAFFSAAISAVLALALPPLLRILSMHP